MVSHLCSGEELLAWRRGQLALGGRSVDLDWLLDLQGELRWAELQRLRLRPELTVSLACSLEALEHLGGDIWMTTFLCSISSVVVPGVTWIFRSMPLP